jgi:hypothetical protein
MFWEERMLKLSSAIELRKRLLRAGFTRAHANRAALELQEHWEDMVEEGLRAGLNKDEAEREASTRVGSPEALTHEFVARLENSSWLGRYPTFGFAMLALTLTILWWVTIGSAAAQYCGLFAHGIKTPEQSETLAFCFDWMRALSFIVLPWLCCHIGDRYFCGWRASLWACLVLAIHNAAHFFEITGAGEHGTVTLGYTFTTAGPPLLPIIAPLAVFALHRAWMLRDQFDSEDSGPTFC